MDFQIAKDDLHRCRVLEATPPELADGQALLAVDTFVLSSNNITYAKFGEAMSYWRFFLADAGLLDSATIILSSASSKTAIGLAFLLSQREGTRVIGLTSERSKEFAARLGVYASVLPYEELDALPPGPAVYVDMAGDAEVREGVHGHLGSSLTHSAVVGATHHDRMGELPKSLPGPRPQFFFAPDRVVKRTADWGGAGLDQ